MIYRSLIETCETYTRQGLTQLAVRKLKDLAPGKIPREWQLPVANLCRRNGLVAEGLRILTPPYAMDREAWLGMVKPAEVAEYALLLQRIGSVNEALRILERVSETEFVDVLLYRAYCHFNRWEYKEALPLLRKYLSYPLGEYKNLVGRVNLAAALVALARTGEARDLLEELDAQCRAQKHFRLVANCQEMMAQLALSNFDLERAKFHVRSSSEVLHQSSTLDELFVRKVQAVAEALEKNSPAPLEHFRREALARHDWESARDMDFFRLKQWFDQDRFHYLIFGTPFPAYRERVIKQFGLRPEIEYYQLGDAKGPVLNVFTGEVGVPQPLTPGGKVHQLLDILTRDFYRPVPLGTLFYELFPGESFDIFSSTNRVHQILRRTRRWLRENNLPVRIRNQNGNYQLTIHGPFAIQVPYERKSVCWFALLLQRLKSRLSADRLYAAHVLRQELGLGPASFRRFAAWALELGHIERIGSGPATAYRTCFTADELDRTG